MTSAAGGAVPDEGAASLYLTGGAGTPSFLSYRNFNVILRYVVRNTPNVQRLAHGM